MIFLLVEKFKYRPIVFLEEFSRPEFVKKAYKLKLVYGWRGSVKIVNGLS